MPVTNEQKPSNSKPSIWPKLITLALILLTVVVAANLLPRGFSQDLSVIGNGTNAVVLVHDSNVIQSTDTMAAMNAVRDDYEAHISFIVPDIMTPEGKAFADKYRFSPTALAFFATDGEVLQTLYSAQTGETLKVNLDTIFNY